MTTKPVTTCDACGKVIDEINGPGHAPVPGGLHIAPRSITAESVERARSHGLAAGASQGIPPEGIDVHNLDCLGVWLARSGKGSVIRYDDDAGLRQALAINDARRAHA